LTPVRSTSALEALMHPASDPSWESPELTSLNRLPPHATLERAPASWRSLDGEWLLKVAERPEAAPAALAAARGFRAVEVPGLWTMQGLGSPQYTNVVMPFDTRPPRVPDENPTGVYRHAFRVPRGWRRSRVVLHFGGVEGALHVLLNGQPVGIAKDARTPAEFDVTGLVRHDGPNELAAVVVRWSDASFIEDQDQWWHAGISRSVRLVATPQTYIADVFARGTLDENCRQGRLALSVDVGGAAAEWEITARLLTPDGRTVLETPLERTGERTAGLEHRLRSTRAWSAEDPALYTLALSLRSRSGAQEVSCRVGFTRVEVRDGRLLVNGLPVLICGVNRHDHDDLRGRAVTPAVMEADARLMKRFNVNAVRTSHYPNDPYWLDLCDRLGLYVVDERRVTRLLRRALPRPALRERVPGAGAQHGRARQEPPVHHPLVARQRERLRAEPRRGRRLGARARPIPPASLRGCDQTRLDGGTSRDGRGLPDVSRAREDRGVGRDEHR
jgi:beta-galactosidase